MTGVHRTALVEDGARVGPGVSIGPFSCIGPEVELGANVSIGAHVVVAGRTSIGPDTVVHPFASLGQPPQFHGYSGELSELIIGARNVIREYVTMNIGTARGGMVTRVGDDGFFMIGSHVAHDCRVGDHVIMANNATLGGHVEIGSHSVVGGLSAVHQHVRIGRHVMVGGLSAVVEDVIPFGLAVGNRARLAGLNIVGLKRRGMPRSEILALRAAYRQLFDDNGRMADRLDAVAAAFAEHRPVQDIVAFIRADSVRPLCRPQDRRAA